MNDPLEINYNPAGKKEVLFIVAGVITIFLFIYLEYLCFLNKDDWFQS